MYILIVESNQLVSSLTAIKPLSSSKVVVHKAVDDHKSSVPYQLLSAEVADKPCWSYFASKLSLDYVLCRRHLCTLSFSAAILGVVEFAVDCVVVVVVGVEVDLLVFVVNFVVVVVIGVGFSVASACLVALSVASSSFLSSSLTCGRLSSLGCIGSCAQTVGRRNELETLALVPRGP